MRILVDRMSGDATVLIYNKQGDLIHTEPFYASSFSSYIRQVPVVEVEYGHSTCLSSGVFEYKVVA